MWLAEAGNNILAVVIDMRGTIPPSGVGGWKETSVVIVLSDMHDTLLEHMRSISQLQTKYSII